MSTRKIVYSTYPSLQSSYKKRCQQKNVSMAEELETLIKSYLNSKLGTPLELNSYLNEVRKQMPQEIKSQKLTLYIDEELYNQLKEHLYLIGIRPATLFTQLMAYCVLQVPKLEDWKKSAELILTQAASDIVAVVYAIQYLKPTETAFEIVHTEYFYDACSQERFERCYEKSHDTPLVKIWYVKR